MCVGDGTKSACYDGYYLGDDGKCVNCDVATGSGDQSEAAGADKELTQNKELRAMACIKCGLSAGATTPTCKKCRPGYTERSGRCLECVDLAAPAEGDAGAAAKAEAQGNCARHGLRSQIMHCIKCLTCSYTGDQDA